jgi:hypothetical protein
MFTRGHHPEKTADYKLAWVPPYHLEGEDPAGFWELEDLKREMSDEPPRLNAPVDIPQSELGAWVMSQVGHPVALEPWEQVLYRVVTRAVIPVGRGRREPVYYVTAR